MTKGVTVPFDINFSACKAAKKAVNDNVHDELYWEYAYTLAESCTPVNKWPTQYTVHYLYEFMNRPWLPEDKRIYDAASWLVDGELASAPDLMLKI